MQQSAAIVIRVNGQAREVHAGPDTPLLYVLRNDLELKGSRFGCGVGNCGSCTVMVDGMAVQSCDTPLWSVVGKEVTSVESLAHLALEQTGAIVRVAFLEEQAAQCGYCINGIMMSVTALLIRTPQPSREEIIAALDRHLCRCGTHVRILRAVEMAINKLNAVPTK